MERVVPESHGAAALLLEDSECIGCEPGAKSGSSWHVEMDSELFYKGLLFCQVLPLL